MKIKITPDQGSELYKLLSARESIDKTLAAAMDHHSYQVQLNSALTDTIWQEIITEHDIPIDTLNLELLQEAGEYFVKVTSAIPAKGTSNG